MKPNRDAMKCCPIVIVKTLEIILLYLYFKVKINIL